MPSLGGEEGGTDGEYMVAVDCVFDGAGGVMIGRVADLRSSRSPQSLNNCSFT